MLATLDESDLALLPFAEEEQKILLSALAAQKRREKELEREKVRESARERVEEWLREEEEEEELCL